MQLRWTLLAVLLFAWTSVGFADDRPNIVVILCDDLGYGDLECYGHPHIKTPHLNQLAEGGIRFTDCYSAAPVCSPSRVGLLTGRSPNRAGVYDWIPPGNKPRPDAREQVHARASEVFLPQLLQKAGYATCMAGKWHCNSQFNRSAQPQPGDCGFDHWFGTQNNAAPSHKNPNNYVRNGKPVGPMKGFSCQLVVDEVVDWLDNRNDDAAKKPFFSFLAFHEPHEPVASPEALVAQYRDVAKNEDQAQYFANVANVDAAVGRFVAALDQRSLRENTLILFTSDNGPETLKRYARAKRSHGTPGELRGMKLHTHDAGFRVVGIANWKGRVDPSRIEKTPVSSLDFLPTFCNLAGSTVPDSLHADGTSIVTLLDGEQLTRDKPLVWCYFNAINEARVAMRDGQWKILARLNGGKFPRVQNVTTENVESVKSAELTDFEIYNIADDIGEKKNLVGQPTQTAPPEKLKQLQEKLNDEYRALIADSHVWTPKVAEPAPSN